VVTQLGNLVDLVNTNDDDFDAEFDTPNIFQNSPYLDDDQVHEVMTNRHNVFTILSLNAQSLNAKIDQLKIYIEYYSRNDIYFSAICLQETWLKDESDFSLLQIPGYSVIHKSSSCSLHGGVAIYLRDSFSYTELDLDESSEVWDGLFIKVEINNRSNRNSKRLVLGNIYRPPRDIIDNYNTPF